MTDVSVISTQNIHTWSTGHWGGVVIVLSMCMLE